MRTGWTTLLLQDEDRGLSRWLSSRPNSMQEARMVAQEIQQMNDKNTLPLPEPAGVIVVGTQALRAFTADQMHAYAAQCLAAAAEDAWRPIETAPKDGAVILLGQAEDGEADLAPISTPGRWHEGYEDGVDYMGHDSGFMDEAFQEFTCPRTFGAENYRTAGHQPTHWQPLPPAPAARKEKP